MSDDDAGPGEFAEHMMEHIEAGLESWVDEHGKPPSDWWRIFVTGLQEDANEQL